VEEAQAIPVGETSATTEDEASSSSVEEAPVAMQEILWTAEGAEGVFTSSRVKRIVHAEEALTPVEQAVYDALWGDADKGQEPHRLAQMGYSELAKRSRVSKRSIQSVIDRLLEKRFIEIHRHADITCRKPTVYRVLGYAAVMKFLQDSGRDYAVRTGRGIFYARRLAYTVGGALASTVDVNGADTVDATHTPQ
jgi:hypothetical protein